MSSKSEFLCMINSEGGDLGLTDGEQLKSIQVMFCDGKSSYLSYFNP